jgi:hypothetical protein
MELEQAITLMIERKIKKLPIVDDQKLLGLVSLTDILRFQPQLIRVYKIFSSEVVPARLKKVFDYYLLLSPESKGLSKENLPARAQPMKIIAGGIQSSIRLLKAASVYPRIDFAETLNYVRNLKFGNHGVFFYRNLHEKHEVLFNFLEAGFQNGEGAIYVAAQEDSKQIRGHMEDFGLNVKLLEREGMLRIFDYDEWYIIDGEAVGPRTKMLTQRVFNKAMEIGLKGVRECGEASCFFEHKKEKELIEYELMIGRKLKLPATALCAYDVNHAKSLEEKFFFNLIKAHGPVVTSSFAQEVKFEDFFPTVISEVLETIFGETSRDTIFRMLEERNSLKLQKIAENPEALTEGLNELIGSGAQIITKSVVKQMHSKMGITQSKITV